MKSFTSSRRLLVCSSAVFCLSLSAAVAAEDAGTPQVVVSPAPAPAPSVVVAPSEPAPARLPYGVADVLKLSHAQVSDDIIQNYIQSTGTIYTLNPQDIVYLRNQGVSDRIVNAMLEQRRRVTEAAAQSAPAAAPGQVPAAAPTYNYAAAPTDAQPQPVPEAAAPASSVYVIPYPQATSAYYSYPSPAYYGSYWGSPYYYGGYYGPSISLGFGFGGYYGHWGGYHGGYYGGYHGGYHGGGGWHGGGGGHGGHH